MQLLPWQTVHPATDGGRLFIFQLAACRHFFCRRYPRRPRLFITVVRQDAMIPVVMAITEVIITMVIRIGSTGIGSMASGTAGNIIRIIVAKGNQAVRIVIKGIFSQEKFPFSD